MLRPHALQRYLPLTQNDPSHFLPPERLVSEAVQDVVRRRLSHVPRFLALVQTESEKVRQYLEWNRDYALLALYPPSEAHRIGGRIQRFGQAFPGLFNFNGKPRAHDLSRDSPDGRLLRVDHAPLRRLRQASEDSNQPRTPDRPAS
jgi:hypothetical protein